MFPEAYRWFFHYTRWLYVGFSFLLYALGAGIARYLGALIDFEIYMLGQIWVISLVLATSFMDDYFSNFIPPMHIQDSSDEIKNEVQMRLSKQNIRLIWSSVFLSTTASLTVVLISTGRLTPDTVTILILGVIGAFLYAIPPARLNSKGYGELVSSILFANLVPAFSFALLFGGIHRFLPMAVFPLIFLHLSMTLVLEFPDYVSYLKQGKKNLLVRAGWENAMTLHNLLILGAYFSLGGAALFGFPSFAVIPSFLPLPLGLLQIYYFLRVSRGAKPNWNALTFSSVALFVFTIYLLAFSFWTH